MSAQNPERYTENEALFVQSDVTQKEGLEFSEQASPEAYAEAEKVIEDLRDEKFDWLGIDWNKVDPTHPGSELTTKIDTANALLGLKERHTSGRRSSEALPWILAASTLIAGCGVIPSKEIQREFSMTYNERLDRAMQDTTLVFPGEGWSQSDLLDLKSWKDSHPEVDRVVIGKIQKAKFGNMALRDKKWHEIYVTVFLKTGETQVLRGVIDFEMKESVLGDPDSLDPENLRIRRANEYRGVVWAIQDYSKPSEKK